MHEGLRLHRPIQVAVVIEKRLERFQDSQMVNEM